MVVAPCAGALLPRLLHGQPPPHPMVGLQLCDGASEIAELADTVKGRP